MKSVGFRILLALVAALVCIPPVPAEVTVSITISGSIDELIPILQKLKELGISDGGEATGDPLNINLHSVSEVEPAGPPPEPIKPPMALAKLTIDPGDVAPGGKITISAGVTDPDDKIDTVVATLHTQTSFNYDLYDNGEKGDTTPGDGIWSFQIDVPAGAALGEYRVSVLAYDRNGDPINGASGAPLTAETTFRVVR